MRKGVLEKALSKSRRLPVIGKNGVCRIKEMMLIILNDSEDIIPPSHKYGMSLILFDGVPIDSIKSVCDAISSITPDGIAISWVDQHGRCYRHILSSITLNIRSKFSNNCIVKVDKKVMASLYQQYFPSHSLQNDQLEWLAHHCSGPLYEHLSRGIQMTALPDSALVRLFTVKSLGKYRQDENYDQLMTQPIVNFFESSIPDRTSAFIEQVIYACRRRPKIADALAKKSMLEECSRLANIVDQYGPISSLILAWAISLVATGTRNQSNLSQATIANYLGVAALKVFQIFKSLDIQELDENTLISNYKKIIDMCSEGQRNIGASAISAFHSFLEDWVGVTEINRRDFHQDVDSIPKANIVWPHEITSILDWLDHATCDERLIQFWRLAILISSEVRIRIGELLSIKMEDIHPFESVVEIFIKGKKTRAAKRTVSIKSVETQESLIQFLKRRNIEGAHQKDYMFGDPKNPTKFYKLGQFYFGFNTLLKSATGDQTVSIHTLSHTVISNKLVSPLVGGEPSFINPLSQHATDFGHFSILTSCSEYMHLHPLSIRKMLNRALSTIAITSVIAERWSNIPAARLRKQISLKKLDANEHYWQSILDCNVANIGIKPVQIDCLLVDPITPNLLSKAPDFKFEKLLYLLRDLSDGISLESVASRNSLDEEMLNRIILNTRDVLFKSRISPEIEANATLSETMGSMQDLKKLRCDFNKVEQPKFNLLLQVANKLTVNLDESTKKGIDGWLYLVKRSYKEHLPLEDHPHTLNFLSFLHLSGVQVTSIAMFIAKGQHATQSKNAMRKLFLMTFSIPPAIFLVEERRGRPKCYFSITNQRVRSDTAPHGSANSISGLNAIMFALAVLKEMNNA